MRPLFPLTILLLLAPSPARAYPCAAGPRTLRLEVPAVVPDRCDPQGCRAPIPVTVWNCSPRPEAFSGLTATGSGPRGGAGWVFPAVTLAPGATWSGQVEVRRADRYRIRLVLPGARGGPEARVRVTSTALEQAVRDCPSCPWNAPAATARTCRGSAAAVTLEVPREVSLACTGTAAARVCRAPIPLVVRNCTADPAIVEAVSGQGPRSYLSGGPSFRPVPLAPGAVWRGTVDARDAGPHAVWLRVRYANATAMNAPSGRLEIRDREREQAIQACRRCQGTWGRHGLLGLESCVCRTRDAGRRCYRHQDCESACLYHRFVITRPARGLAPALGIVEGRCAATTPLWGCVRVVNGTTARPQPTHAATYGTWCID